MDDAISVDSQAAPHASFPMSTLPPPPHTSSTRSYWYSLAWWKPATNSEDMFEARPAPPSYDAAMQQASHRTPPASIPRGADRNFPEEDDSGDSLGGESLAPPYSEIHHDPIIPDWVMTTSGQETSNATGLPAAATSGAHSRPGAALVLPVPPPPFSHLSHVATLRRPRSQMEETTIEAAPSRTEEAGTREDMRAPAVAAPNRSPHHATLPHVIRRMRARSREGIVLPPEERDAVLQRFSLQLQLNISASSSDSSSSALGAPQPADEAIRESAGRRMVEESHTSISSSE